MAMDNYPLVDLLRVLVCGTVIVAVCAIAIYGGVLLDRYERRLEDSATAEGEEVIEPHEVINV